jgi:hypothetical protein
MDGGCGGQDARLDGVKLKDPSKSRFPALQRGLGGLKTALMKRDFSSAEGGRLDITPEWDVIQTCIFTYA